MLTLFINDKIKTIIKMASKWGKSHGESGILRKYDGPEKIEDLLVFGYACKLFRDDEKALEIDQGKHLIPWIGDETLKIDRYDCRGALSDLSQFEGSSEGFDTRRWMGLTDAEKKIEQSCDEERYRALRSNEDEEEMYREEELKRLHQQLSNAQNYGQVSYSYEVSAEDKSDDNKQQQNDSDDELFVPRPELDIPVGMTLPKTMKQNARIEKTAAFISEQGAQMEILLKAKQAGNPQFEFLSHESSLYRYYRHILMAIKTGRYRLQDNTKPETEQQEPEEEDDHYLHPSLGSVPPRVELAPSIPNIAYKPSANCAYSMLVNKIRGTKPAEETPPNSVNKTVTTLPESNATQNFVYSTQTTTYTLPPHATYTYNFATGKYEPTTSCYVHGQTGSSLNSNSVYPQTVPSAQISSHQAYGNMGQNSSTTYSANSVANHYASYAAYAQAYGQELDAAYFVGEASVYNTGEISKGAVLYSKTSNANQVTPSLNNQKDDKSEKNAKVQTIKHNPILPIAHYSSGSESESEDDENATKAIINIPQFETPNEDMQVIIDKMASYVARNGRDFENIVRAKGDPRFEFLNESHVYNGYYRHKLKSYGAVIEEPKETVKKENNLPSETDSQSKEEKQEPEEKCKDKEKVSGEKEKKIIAPVSFSIKKPKESEPVPIVERSALPVEESSDEENENEGAENKIKDEKAVSPEQSEQKTDVEVSEVVVKPESNGKNVESAPSIIEIDDKQELIDLTDDTEEKKDIKRAEDRIKDKLAAAAREKMSLLSRDKALQLERKRRAAAFLSKIKPTELIVTSSSSAAVQQKTEPSEAEEDDLMKRLSVIDENNKDSVELDSSSRKVSVKRSRSRSRSCDRRHRHKSSKRKKKSHRESSCDSPKKSHKHSKHSHHSRDKKKSKRKHKSRSRSRSHHSRSRSSHCTDRFDRDKDKESTDKEKIKKSLKSDYRSSGELTPNTSSYSSD